MNAACLREAPPSLPPLPPPPTMGYLLIAVKTLLTLFGPIGLVFVAAGLGLLDHPAEMRMAEKYAWFSQLLAPAGETAVFLGTPLGMRALDVAIGLGKFGVALNVHLLDGYFARFYAWAGTLGFGVVIWSHKSIDPPYESLRALSAIVLLHLYAHLMRRPLAPLSGVATAIHLPVAARHKPALAAAKKKTS